jgi:hypothetical protein
LYVGVLQLIDLNRCLHSFLCDHSFIHSLIHLPPLIVMLTDAVDDAAALKEMKVGNYGMYEIYYY